MKFLFLVFCILLGITHLSYSITLQDALNNRLIKLSVLANPIINNPLGSFHTGQCLKLIITNISSQNTTIKIEHAYRFENQENKHQDLISCDSKEIYLTSNQNKVVNLNALCCEKHNSSPSDDDTFLFKRKELGSIERLCSLLEKQKNFGNTAQQALWCLTDNSSVNDIVDTYENIQFEDELIKFIATEKGLPIPERKLTPQRILRYAIETEGSYSKWIDKPTKIGIYITDSANTILITLMAEEIENRGKGNLKYTYGYRGLLPKGIYFLQAKLNGEWIKEKEIVVGPN